VELLIIVGIFPPERLLRAGATEEKEMSAVPIVMKMVHIAISIQETVHFAAIIQTTVETPAGLLASSIVNMDIMMQRAMPPKTAVRKQKSYLR
jgi:hypothetical protein